MQKKKHEVIVLARQDLYDRAWMTAMRTLAPELGMSDVGLRKICELFSVLESLTLIFAL